MKIVVNARQLASAAALTAALAADDKRAQKIAGLGALQIVADGARAEIVGNVFDHELRYVLSGVTVAEPGILALGAKLAKLTAEFPSGADVVVECDGTTGRISCGRSRFKLPAIPQNGLPGSLALGDGDEIGRITLSRAELLRAFAATSFAMGDDQTRQYLIGLCMHDCKTGLAVVATDGHRLARVIHSKRNGLRPERDRTLIVPASTVKITSKLLNADRTIESVALRRSKTLLAIESVRFSFVTKLIDGVFPAYEGIIPARPDNSALVDRDELAQAIARLAAVADRSPIGLTWSSEEPILHLCLAAQPDLGEDEIAATVTGRRRRAIAVDFIAEQIDALTTPRVRLSLDDGPTTPLVVIPDDDENYLGLISPMRWAQQP